MIRDERINGGITPEELDRFRRELKIGTVVTQTIVLDELGKRLAVPVRKVKTVVRKHPYLVELSGDGLPVATVTYRELMLGEENTDV